MISHFLTSARWTPRRGTGRALLLGAIVMAVGSPTMRPLHAADASVSLQAKWNVGQRYVQRITMRQDQVISLPKVSKPMQQTITQSQEIAVDVTQATPDGGRTLDMEFLAMSMEMKMGDTTMLKFDSKSNPQDDSSNPIAKTYRALLGAHLKFILDASGDVERVEGVDALKAKMRAGMGGAAGNMIQDMVNEGTIKQMGILPQGLPDKAVKIGDSWPVHLTFPLQSMGQLNVAERVKFSGWDTHDGHRCALLTSTGFLSGGPATGNGSVAISSASGTIQGKTWFDPKLGAVREKVTEQKTQMKVKAMGTETPIKTHQWTTNRLVEVGPMKK